MTSSKEIQHSEKFNAANTTSPKRKVPDFCTYYFEDPDKFHSLQKSDQVQLQPILKNDTKLKSAEDYPQVGNHRQEAWKKLDLTTDVEAPWKILKMREKKLEQWGQKLNKLEKIDHKRIWAVYEKTRASLDKEICKYPNKIAHDLDNTDKNIIALKNRIEKFKSLKENTVQASTRKITLDSLQNKLQRLEKKRDDLSRLHSQVTSEIKLDESHQNLQNQRDKIAPNLEQTIEDVTEVQKLIPEFKNTQGTNHLSDKQTLNDLQEELKKAKKGVSDISSSHLNITQASTKFLEAIVKAMPEEDK